MGEIRLEGLAYDIRTCRLCVEHPAGKKALPHEPRPVAILSDKAKILIAGQAPGMRVHNSGIPFTDASGERLREWLGVTSAQFYNPAQFAILPMGFCFPGYDAKGSDLPPRKECAPLWRDRAMAAMPQIEMIVAIGLYAQAWHLQGRIRKSMTDTVLNWRSLAQSNAGPVIMPLPHPSWRNTGWLKRNAWFEEELLPELKKRVNSLIS
jgi:uracil-DNA glycosylase